MKGATRRDAKKLQSGNVSIHAPVKGATCGTVWCDAETRVSIHAPVKGATDGDIPAFQPVGFNPRAREGRDRVEVFGWEVGGFNPRAREGRDPT